MKKAGLTGETSMADQNAGNKSLAHGQGGPRKLTTHPKKRKLNKNHTSLNDRLEELSTSANPANREELLKILLMLHERFPSEESQRHLESWVNRFELEEKIEMDDPVSIDEAITRVLKDVDTLFNATAEEALHSHFFSDIALASSTTGRPDVESQWMTRWVSKGREGTKRRLDEWTKLIGFTGEYLVSTVSFFTNR